MKCFAIPTLYAYFSLFVLVVHFEYFVSRVIF